MSIYQTFKKMQSGPIMIGIAVFGILTFTITYAVNQTFARDPRKEKFATVTLPSGKTASFTAEDHTLAQAAFNLFLDSNGQGALINQPYMRSPQLQNFGRQLGTLVPWTAAHSKMEGGIKRKQDNNEVQQVMLVNAIARDRGIDVALAEVANWLEAAFENPEQYRQLCGLLSMTYPVFQAVLREAMLFNRAVDLMLAQTPVPTGDQLVKEWSERNEKFTFDVVSFSAEERKKAIDEKTITNEELKKWLDEQGPMKSKKYEEPEKYELEGLAVLNEGLAPSGKLNDAFDALVKSTVVQESDVQTYFALARIERFKRPAPESRPESSPESKPESNPATQPAVQFYTVEEKKQEAVRELQIAKALEKVKAEAEQAMTQPGFDLKKFADQYGLTYWKTDGGKVLADLRTYPVHGCTGLVSGSVDVQDGKFYAAYQPAPGAVQVTRLVNKTIAKVPDVADIRAKLIPDYLDEKSFTFVRDDAVKFRDAVEDAKVEGGENAFDKVAKEKGLEVKRLAPIPKAAMENGDVDYSERAKDVSQFLASLYDPAMRKFMAMEPDPFALKKDAVSPPLKNQEGKAVYVVRCADRQLPTIEEMGPSDYASVKERSMREFMFQGRPKTLFAYVRERNCLEMITSTALEKSLKLERKSGAAQ